LKVVSFDQRSRSTVYTVVRAMDEASVRLLIRQKLADGRLPHDHIPRVWGGPGNGEICDACDQKIERSALVMEGIAVDGRKPLQLHVACFHLWDSERRDGDGIVVE